MSTAQIIADLEQSLREYVAAKRAANNRITVQDVVDFARAHRVDFWALTGWMEGAALVRPGLCHQLRSQGFRAETAEALPLEALWSVSKGVGQ